MHCLLFIQLFFHWESLLLISGTVHFRYWGWGQGLNWHILMWGICYILFPWKVCKRPFSCGTKIKQHQPTLKFVCYNVLFSVKITKVKHKEYKGHFCVFFSKVCEVRLPVNQESIRQQIYASIFPHNRKCYSEQMFWLPSLLVWIFNLT